MLRPLAPFLSSPLEGVSRNGTDSLPAYLPRARDAGIAFEGGQISSTLSFIWKELVELLSD